MNFTCNVQQQGLNLWPSGPICIRARYSSSLLKAYFLVGNGLMQFISTLFGSSIQQPFFLLYSTATDNCELSVLISDNSTSKEAKIIKNLSTVPKLSSENSVKLSIQHPSIKLFSAIGELNECNPNIAKSFCCHHFKVSAEDGCKGLRIPS